MTWRWVTFVVVLGLYVTRVFLVNGWYIVTYGLGIYLLNQFIGFLSPQVRRGRPMATGSAPCEGTVLMSSVVSPLLMQMDPESDGPVLPTSEREEFRCVPLTPNAHSGQASCL